MSSGGFAGGFAQGFGQMFSISQQNKRARENNILRQRQMDLQERRFNEQMGLEQERLGLSERRLNLEEQQMENLEQHREYDLMLKQKQYELNLRKQDFDVLDKMLGFLDPEKSKPVRKGAVKLFAQHLGVDTSNPTYKTMEEMFLNLEPEELEHLTKMVLDKYSDQNWTPGQGKALAKMLMEDPETAMDVMKFFSGETDDEFAGSKVILDNDGNAVYAEDDESIVGQRAPGPQYKSPEQDRREKVLDKQIERDHEFIQTVTTKGESAQGRKAQVDTFLVALDQLKDQEGFETGTAANLRATASRWAEFLNINPEDIGLDRVGVGDAAMAEVMEAMSNQLSLKVAADLSRLTNLSLSFVSASMPNLVRTPEGNALILQIMKAEDDRLIQYAEWAEDYETKYGGPRPDPETHPHVPSLQEKIRNDQRINPLVSADQIAEWSRLAEKGKGINLEELAGDVGEASGKLIPPNYPDLEYPVVGLDKLGNKLVTIGQGPGKQTMPAFWSEEALERWAETADPGSYFVWLPAEEGEDIWRKLPDAESSSGPEVGSEEWKQGQMDKLKKQLAVTGADDSVVQKHLEDFRASLDEMYPPEGE